MKKLLLMLSLIFLTSPAMANTFTLEHGKSYTDHIISCSTKEDVMQHIRDISQVPEPFTTANVMATITDNNCVLQKQHFTYINEEYVCSFSLHNRNFTLLNTKVEGIEQFIIVQALAIYMVEPCLETKEMEKNIKG